VAIGIVNRPLSLRAYLKRLKKVIKKRIKGKFKGKFKKKKENGILRR
jgi:hypothetical protein